MEKIKNNLYLIGAGDLGREMESWLQLLPNFNQNWEIKGYLDQNPDALDGYPSDFVIIGNPFSFKFASNDYVLLCITDIKSKQYLISKLKDKVKFFSYIAPNAILGKFINLGVGVVICPNSCISTNVEIGDFVFINNGTHIGHDCIIGTYCSLMSHVDLGGHVKLGERVYIGTNATIIPGKTINENITIGSGSIVIQNLKKPGTYFGNPASLVVY
jgi:sugar O-acyltransferase (sialic acid O-acetyltransferase NeuD family)